MPIIYISLPATLPYYLIPYPLLTIQYILVPFQRFLTNPKYIKHDTDINMNNNTGLYLAAVMRCCLVHSSKRNDRISDFSQSA